MGALTPAAVTIEPTKSATPPESSAPVVLFTVANGVLAPVVCLAGAKVLESANPECIGLVPRGANVWLDNGKLVPLGATTEAACRGGSNSTFEGRGIEPSALEKANYAIWPESAHHLVVADGANLTPTAAEAAAMVTLLKDEWSEGADSEPKLETTSGLTVDVDGDGTIDRIFAAHDSARLYGLIAAFLGKTPKTPVALSVGQFNHPRLLGSTDLDGKPGREVWFESTFVEGLEGGVVASGTSQSVIALRAGKPTPLGSWGCRFF